MSCANDVPRWNLDGIFGSTESEKYKQAVADYVRLMDGAERYLSQVSGGSDFCEWLVNFLETANALASASTSLSAFTYIVYSTDTTNTNHLTAISQIEELNLRYTKISNAFEKILFAHKNDLQLFYEKFPQYSEYKFLLEEFVSSAEHQMSEAEENLAGDLQRTGGDAWSRLHEQLISTMRDAETGKTFNELRNDAYSADAALRKSSYEKEIALLRQNEVAFAACLNNLKGETVCLNKRRGWQSAIDRSLSSARISKKTLDALISAIEESLPSWRKYLQAKASLLRKRGATADGSASGSSSASAGVSVSGGIAFYDLFAPLPDAPLANDSRHSEENSPAADASPLANASHVADDSRTADASPFANESLVSRTWTFAEAKDYIIERYSSFSKAMGEFAGRAFDENWIDAEVRSGKVGGAYDEDFPLGHQSRILTNFTGSFSDVITLAHELGHAFHFSCMKGLPAMFFAYPMTLAETASTFAETIVKQDALAKAVGNDKIKLLETDLSDACQVLVDILCRFYFEKNVFEERQKRELSAQDFCRIMRYAQEKTYGSGLSAERHEYMWAVKSHYYSTGLDFYNFPYAFGQLFAASLYERYKNEGESFVAVYEELLASTGNRCAEQVCAKAGFDIEQKKFWSDGIALYLKEIDEFLLAAR